MKYIDGVLGGKNERLSMEDCTVGDAGVADGWWKGSIEDPFFDCFL